MPIEDASKYVKDFPSYSKERANSKNNASNDEKNKYNEKAKQNAESSGLDTTEWAPYIF